MVRNITVVLSFLLIFLSVKSQTGQGTIKGTMTDRNSGEPLPFANIVIMKGGAQVAGTMTDFDGKYTVPALAPGKYDLQATYVGYQPIKIAGIVVNSGKITFSDVKAGQGVALDAFEIIDYEVPLISKDQTSSGGTITRDDIAKMPGRSAASVAATVGGVNSTGGGLSVRGTRASATVTFIDGIKVRGSQNLPNSAIEQVSVVTGGIPAEYGDATGGVVNITTRGASKDWFGGLELVSSGFKAGDKVYGLDQYARNLLAFSVSGPLKMKKDSTGEKQALVGFFLAGEVRHTVDPRPFFGGDVKVKDDVMAELNANPISIREDAVGGVINNASYLTANDFETTPYRLNVASEGFNLAGKIDVNTSSTTNLTFGGSFDYGTNQNYARNFSLLNFQNYSQSISNTWRAYARFTQRFRNSEGEESASSIKNAFISFQVDYTNTYGKTQHADHQDQLSRYGYVGKFTSTRENSFSPFPVVEQVEIVDQNGDSVTTISGYMSVPNTIQYDFEASDINPVLSNYTQSYYDIYEGQPQFLQRPTLIEGGGGLLNGSVPINVYDMWSPMGVQANGYSISNTGQFRMTVAGSADIKGHAIKLGVEYEQRDDRFYTVSPYGLWTIGRGLVNAHLSERDVREGTYTSEVWNDGISRYTFQPFYNAENQSQFDKNIREKLGLPVDGLDWVDFDSYGPDFWEVSDFSADELLLSSGGQTVNYAGYDHTGKRTTRNPSLSDFFTRQDENGNFTRDNAAFRPIYVAGYIQDKFAFDDLVFNIGVRVDRFDANQPVLKDPFTLFPAMTVGDLGYIENFPSNIANDYVVYVADVANPSKDEIIGYRNGDTWYNSTGQEINDPSILSSSGSPAPWLVSPEKTSVATDLDASSFKDYEPQVNVSPRIAFSFPISDEALFFAHYDVLVQRPTSNNRLELIDYLLMQTNSNVINNPDLKPEKTIDYELGFQQKINNYSALKIAAFYKEQRDMIQITQNVGAYPETYSTYGNLDFSTVKGVTVNYDLRRKGNISMRANYTLQFAEGTGSGTATSAALLAAGNGNIRTLSPLSFDNRHVFNLTADYRYRSGKNYNGPVLFGKDILANMGLNVTYNTTSGSPYTKRSVVVPTVLIQNSPASGQEADLNGSRLPWTSNLNLRIDKDIQLRWGKGDDENKKTAGLNIYIQVLNALNTKNVLGVYPATGTADDDGFLAAAEWQALIESQLVEQSYRDLYAVKVNNPALFSAPRRIRLGVLLNF